MKKLIIFLTALFLALDAAVFAFAIQSESIPVFFRFLPAVTAVLLIICGAAALIKHKSLLRRALFAVTAAVLCICVFTFRFAYPDAAAEEPEITESENAAVSEPEIYEEEPEVPVIKLSKTEYSPYMTETSNPESWEIEWKIFEGTENVENYDRTLPIHFGDPDNYFALPGIATFRGNNYRNTASYGTAEVTDETFDLIWSHNIGALGDWGGCGWTGQPLIVQWDDETKQIMNLYDDKKEKEGLVEVIYATLDGSVHFYDMEDGTKTRDPIYIGMNFKGAGALDPRGYPLLYVGSGVNLGNKTARMYIVSLIDGTILWQQSGADENAIRGWYAFDSSPLVDAETDTIIWPGENGILYTFDLNTDYDKKNETSPYLPIIL